VVIEAPLGLVVEVARRLNAGEPLVDAEIDPVFYLRRGPVKCLATVADWTETE
jgi:hypothetical protein